MKKPTIYRLTGAVLILMMLFAIPTVVMAQDHIDINKNEVKSWLQQNWIWVALGVLFILVIAVSTGSRRRNRRIDRAATTTTTTVVRDDVSTTVVRDDLGNVKRVTTDVIK